MVPSTKPMLAKIVRDPDHLYAKAIKIYTIKAMTGTIASEVTSTND